MRIDRDKWRSQWDEGDFPSLPCPNCSAPLNFDENSLVVRTSAYSRELLDFTDVDEPPSRFSAWFVCGYSKCGEVVSISGDCYYQYGYNNVGQTITERKFQPRAMNPGPPVVPISDDVPEPIFSTLKDSFGLLWVSNEACAGRLRVVLELVLDNQGFPVEPDPGKFVSLDQRIKGWHSRHRAYGIAQSFMAVKWLGNVGSHETRISRDRLLDAYEILYRVLVQLFPPDERDLDELSEKIVKSKGRSD